MLGLLF